MSDLRSLEGFCSVIYYVLHRLMVLLNDKLRKSESIVYLNSLYLTLLWLAREDTQGSENACFYVVLEYGHMVINIVLTFKSYRTAFNVRRFLMFARGCHNKKKKKSRPSYYLTFLTFAQPCND